LRTALTTAFSELGAPEVLVYNAALLRGDSPTDGDTEGWISALAVDVIGAKVAAETVLPALRDKRGSLLFTGGGLAMTPSPEYASLSVGKAALRTYVQTLHAQQVGTEVHATSVTIFGKIGGKEPRFAPDVIARHYLELHRQPQPTWQDELVLD
jgi:NADP-dependent 3-hydroxy acid dehydrogenase YdfG